MNFHVTAIIAFAAIIVFEMEKSTDVLVSQLLLSLQVPGTKPNTNNNANPNTNHYVGRSYL